MTTSVLKIIQGIDFDLTKKNPFNVILPIFGHGSQQAEAAHRGEENGITGELCLAVYLWVEGGAQTSLRP